ncbi:MAG: thioredoxin family protein [Bacteroidota bacterium]
MKISILFFLIFSGNLLSAQNYYEDAKALDCIRAIRAKADSLEAVGEREVSFQMRFDSVTNCLLGLKMSNFSFENISSEVLDFQEISTPILLITSASWCKPCKAEIPAINKIAERYEGKLKVILLFWDKQEKVEKMRLNYSSFIELVPSKEHYKNEIKLAINDFEHYLGFPTSYFISRSKEIVMISQGAVMAREAANGNPAISEQQANRMNYNSIKKEVERLLRK